MNTQTAGNSPLNIVALGWAIAAALIVLFVICLVISFIFPDLPASQGWSAWIALFSVTPTEHPFLSVRVWIDGIGFSLVFGWVTAVVLGLIYNRLISR
jgi:phosphotransferase system  glucose/maltose/N-acetylglucosamine-specific IIC component